MCVENVNKQVTSSKAPSTTTASSRTRPSWWASSSTSRPRSISRPACAVTCWWDFTRQWADVQYYYRHHDDGDDDDDGWREERESEIEDRSEFDCGPNRSEENDRWFGRDCDDDDEEEMEHEGEGWYADTDEHGQNGRSRKRDMKVGLEVVVRSFGVCMASSPSPDSSHVQEDHRPCSGIAVTSITFSVLVVLGAAKSAAAAARQEKETTVHELQIWKMDGWENDGNRQTEAGKDFAVLTWTIHVYTLI